VAATAAASLLKGSSAAISGQSAREMRVAAAFVVVVVAYVSKDVS